MELDTPRHKGLRRELVKKLQKKGINALNVLAAIGRVPRHLFLRSNVAPELAYADRALPLTLKQTISQPYTVAFQTMLLDVAPGMKVLEVGTGSGYQAAVLAELGAKVYSIERFPELAAHAKQTLQSLNYTQVFITVGDGSLGLPQFAPYDRVIVTAAAPEAPVSLLQQLKIDGILVIPVGTKNVQTMLRIRRTSKDTFIKEKHGNFVFVPLVGKEGWQVLN